MDWGRAKTILIVILLALNALLGVALVSRAAGNGSDERIYRDVAQILESRGVTMLCEFPKNVKASELLIYEDGSKNAAQAAQALAASAAKAGPASGARVEPLGKESIRYVCARPGESLPKGSEQELDAALRAALADMGLDVGTFLLDGVEWAGDGGAWVQYVQAYQGKLVFDRYVRARVTPEGGVAEIVANLRGIRGVTPNKPMKVIPAYQVVLRHYNKNGQTIRAVDVGFMGQSASQESSIKESEEGAVWRVRLEDGSSRYFEAAYGDEIFVEQ